MSRIVGKIFSGGAEIMENENRKEGGRLESMTVAQLIAMAAEAGIAVPPNAKKADIIAVIEDAIAEESDEFKG